MGSLAQTVTGRRARPLPPGARRAALIAATLPLIRKHGIEVSTRQIAETAGVAEGTIFRVFPDKDSLIQACIDAAFDPAPVVTALEEIDPSLALEPRLIEIVRIVQRWLTSVIHLMMVLRGTGPLRDKPHLRRPRPSEIVGAAIIRLIEPDRDALRVAPPEAERVLRYLLFSGSHPGITDGKLLTPEEIVGVILDGVRARAGERSSRLGRDHARPGEIPSRPAAGSKGRTPC
ncbi:MAG: TetR/AcrR family transcriptional regulator [Steroidobacteraceae bacterium]